MRLIKRHRNRMAAGGSDHSGLSMAPVDAGAPERADAFARAARHSRSVKVLKFILPVSAAIMAAVFVSFSYFSTSSTIAVHAEGGTISDGRLVMANPNLDGLTKDNLPYSMKALRAIQDFQNEGVIELEGIDAKLPISADNIATIDALRGVFDRNSNTLDINSPITVTTTDGMVAKLQSAFLDIANGDLKTNHAVDITIKGTKITSDSLSVLENGKVLVFENKVRMNIDPARAKAAQDKTAADGGS